MKNTKTPVTLIAAIALTACATGDMDSGGRGAGTRLVEHGEGIDGRYIVMMSEYDLDDGHALSKEERDMAEFAAMRGVVLENTFGSKHRGFVAKMSHDQALEVAADPRVMFVEKDAVIRGDAVAGRPGLDRIDQRDLPLDGQYNADFVGGGVTAYIIDSGVRVSHEQFQGRAIEGFTSVSDGLGAQDCNGHGTHVAGIVGGASYGVAPDVELVSVRVLGCGNEGTVSGLIEGLSWVRDHATTPAVANISIAAPPSLALQTAVAELIEAGVTVVTSAGNDTVDACNQAPANMTAAVTVAATDAQDYLADFSNYGSCVDLAAPGVGIRSASFESDDGSMQMSGTSQAAPHVAGAAALLLEEQPDASPAVIAERLMALSTPEIVRSVPPGTSRSLLFVGSVEDTPPGEDEGGEDEGGADEGGEDEGGPDVPADDGGGANDDDGGAPADCVGACVAQVEGLCHGLFGDRCADACAGNAQAVTSCLAPAVSCADTFVCTL